MSERTTLVKLIQGIDNGADLQFLPMDPSAAPGDIPVDAAEGFAQRGIPYEDGTWFGWDRVTDENVFFGGTLTGTLQLWAHGDAERLMGLLRKALPSQYYLSHDPKQPFILINRTPSAQERQLPDLKDEKATIAYIGRIDATRPDQDGYLEQEQAAHEARVAAWEQTDPVVWLQTVMAEGTKAEVTAAIKVIAPSTPEAIGGLLPYLKELAKDFRIDTLLWAMDSQQDPRLDETVDQLAAMRGFGPRCAVVEYLARRADTQSEQILHKWMTKKRRYPKPEPVPGATRAYICCRAWRTGCSRDEVATEMLDDPKLSDDVKVTVSEAIPYLNAEHLP